MKLVDLQDAFQQHMLSGADDIFAEVLDANKDDKKTRMGVYYKAYRLRLLDILKADYPVVLQLLGEDKFETLAFEYIEQYPSTHYSITHFGQSFHDFLSKQGLTPYIKDIALFEWKMGLAGETCEQLALTLERLQKTLTIEDWPKLTFEFHSSLSFFVTRFNIIPLWNKLTSENNEVITENDFIEAKHNACLIWRKGIEVFYRSLSFNEFACLHLMLKGHCFADICEYLAEKCAQEEASQMAANFLHTWITNELVIDFELN